jgi:hypothetical protein
MNSVTGLLPAFVSTDSATSDSVIVGDNLAFPIALVPLQGSLSIKRPQTYIKHEYANGDEQRERRGLSRGFITASFNLLMDEDRMQKTVLDSFYEQVESHREFYANVPGVGTRLWFFQTPPEITHVGASYWNASISLKSQRDR